MPSRGLWYRARLVHTTVDTMAPQPVVRSALLLLAAAILASTSAAARPPDLRGWSASIGQFDVAEQEQETLEFGIDFRFRRVFWGLEPIVGLGGTSDEAVFGYGGVARPFELGNSPFFVVPNFAVSLFENGDGKDLGQALEFRTGLELLYQLPRGTRVGVGFYHLSNSSLDEINPGANSLLLRVVLPRGR